MPFLTADTLEFAANRVAALDALKELTPAWVDKPVRRQQMLLWNFDQGEAAGWAFRVGPWYSNALDIRYTPRTVNGRTTHEWTQGNAFDFAMGYTTASTGWELDGMRSPVTVQVLESRPASPATVMVHRWAYRPDETELSRRIAEIEESGCRCEWRYEEKNSEPHGLYVMTPRNIGIVRLQVLVWEPLGWSIVGQLVMSQDDLVAALIRGFDDSHVAVLREARHEHGMGL